MKPTTKQQPQAQETQHSTEQRSQALEEKQLTLEELASVAGGYIRAEDSKGNKVVLK